MKYASTNKAKAQLAAATSGLGAVKGKWADRPYFGCDEDDRKWQNEMDEILSPSFACQGCEKKDTPIMGLSQLAIERGQALERAREAWAKKYVPFTTADEVAVSRDDANIITTALNGEPGEVDDV